MSNQDINIPFRENCEFALSKSYIDAHADVHIPFRENCEFTGNPRYASVNAHLGYEQLRRDAMEAAMYMPVDRSQHEQRRRIAQVKMTTSIDAVCALCEKEFSGA
jgi:hypothetical protein